MSVLPRRSWLEIPVEEWDRVMAVNLRGLFLCSRAVMSAMKERGRGKIVNISSSRVWDGTPNRLHYTTSKAGVIGFTRVLARELGEFNITVNAVTPGLTLSETQVATTSNNYAATRSSGSVRSGATSTRRIRCGTVMFLRLRGERFHHRADHQRRRRQGDALNRQRAAAKTGEIKAIAAGPELIHSVHSNSQRKRTIWVLAGTERERRIGVASGP